MSCEAVWNAVRRREMRIAAALIASLLLGACASAPGPAADGDGSVAAVPQAPVDVRPLPAPTPGPPVPNLRAPQRGSVGIASWYGRRFHGRKTASGERFDMNAATAAHRTLPFGTRVRVTNVANGRQIVLRINDRGPFVRGRIIDVSRHGAEALDFVRTGTARVRVEVLERPRG